ncbi:MAG TPA: hypothetical protein VGM31_16275 [Puia sp.]
MSVNLPPQYRVIAIVVVFGVAFSTLAWSGDNRLYLPSIPGSDTIPSHPKPGKKPLKPRKKVEEGRVARELDLRMDVDDMDMPEPTELDALSERDIPVDMDAWRGLNARIEADVLKNVDAWNNLDALKELDFPGRDGLDALDELKDMVIEDEDLQALKELNIDDEIWNELKYLKETMDDLRNDIEEERTKGADEYRVRQEVQKIIEAVRAEIPRVRKEVERAMREYKDGQGRQWQ